MAMRKANGPARLLTAAGAALLVIAAAAAIRTRMGNLGRPSAPPAAAASPTPATVARQDVATPTAPLLSPTAAAAATNLPPTTAIPTAGPASSRPAAAARIAIPAVGIDAPVVEVGWHLAEVGGEPRGAWDTVAGAAGHHRGSADLGQPGNCAISGHSSAEGGAVFRRLGELAAGSRIVVETAGGQRYEYVVAEVVTLEEVGATAAERREHARWLDPTSGPALTLVTCWPDWSYTHRIVVRARLQTP